jgi:bifunctional DNA-binding transcriptional regulator/antitoxin component of YhaV-PrlF toxin-antitoxin module
MPARRRKPAPEFAERKARYRAGRSRGADEIPPRLRLPDPQRLPDGTVRYALSLGPKGRVLFPVDLREALGLREGDVITAWLRDGELRLHSHRHGLRKIQEQARSTPSATTTPSQELMAERRAESAKETAETREWLRRHRQERN